MPDMKIFGNRISPWMSVMRSVVGSCAIGLLAALLCGCGGPTEVRTYMEIQQTAERTPEKEGRAAGIVWTKPEGWSQLPKQTAARGGISIDRIATFTVSSEEDAEDEAQVTLVAFPTAGGMAGNLDRWLRQLLASPSPAEKQSFLDSEIESFTTKGGQTGMYADLSSFVPDEPSAQSMLTGTITLEDDRVLYAKMTGSRGLLAKQKEAFERLCESIK